MNIIVTEKNKDVINEAVNTLIEKQWHEGCFKDALRTAMLAYGATKEEIDVFDNHSDDIDAICELFKKYVWDREDNQEEENPYLAANEINQFFYDDKYIHTVGKTVRIRSLRKEEIE